MQQRQPQSQQIDLDIANYGLDDLLRLFHMPMDFTENDLKQAKAIVLKTHPDKSQLPPDYFRFYSKAYKTVHSLWEFRKKGDINKKGRNTDYIIDDTGAEKKELLDHFFVHNKKLDFNAWFNEQFDKNKIVSEKEEKGYETWLRSDDDGDNGTASVTMATMGIEMEKKKRELRSLVVHQDVQEWWGGNTKNSSDLSGDAPATYDSDMFSSLPYQDLQKAHTESVIPVTYEDYEQKEKFGSVNEYMAHRSRQDTKPLSEQQALQLLKKRESLEEETTVRRAYQLAKQTEMAQEKQKEFWSTIQRIK